MSRPTNTASSSDDAEQAIPADDPLTTKEGWRRFVDHQPHPPTLPTAAQWAAMTGRERTAHDEARRDYHGDLPLVNTPTIQKVITTSRLLIQLNRRQVSARRGVIISGASGTGKTTALTQLGRTHERHTRKRHPQDHHRLPVLYVTVPPAATARMLAVEFARFLGLEFTARANITDIVNAVCATAAHTRLELALGGPVTRLLAHHRYVCTRHRYWIGPPDIDQPATPLARLDDIVAAQRHHLRLLHRHGRAAVYDAVLTGLMIYGHFWNERTQTPTGAWNHWTRRADLLIPPGTESATFSASRLFAAVYPEAVNLAALISSPTWRRLATGDTNQQRRFTTEVGRRLGEPHYEPGAGDAVAHWMITDASRPPSGPNKAFPDTRSHGATRPTTTSAQSRQRHDRSSHWFGRHRRGGGIILHHRHIRPVLIREWSPKMDGFDAQIWASRTTVAI